MARFFSRKLTHPYTGAVYEIEFGIDQIASDRKSLAVEVKARKIGGNDNTDQEITALVTVELNDGLPTIIIEIEGEEIGRINLDSSSVAEADEDDVASAERDTNHAWEVLRSHLQWRNGTLVGDVADQVEQFIEAFPAFDPLLGCILKSAISAIVGQTIRCYGQLPRKEMSPGLKLKEIAKCLGVKAGGMLIRASWRSVRCMVRGGF